MRWALGIALLLLLVLLHFFSAVWWGALFPPPVQQPHVLSNWRNRTRSYEATEAQAQHFHHPSQGDSGATWGFGEDLKTKGAAQYRKDCRAAGVSESTIEFTVAGCGLHGIDAARFVEKVKRRTIPLRDAELMFQFRYIHAEEAVRRALTTQYGLAEEEIDPELVGAVVDAFYQIGAALFQWKKFSASMSSRDFKGAGLNMAQSLAAVQTPERMFYRMASFGVSPAEYWTVLEKYSGDEALFNWSSGGTYYSRGEWRPAGAALMQSRKKIVARATEARRSV